MNINFYIEAEWNDSLITIGIIYGVKDYDILNDAKLRKYLKDERKDSKEVVNFNSLDDIVAKELRIKMSN